MNDQQFERVMEKLDIIVSDLDKVIEGLDRNNALMSIAAGVARLEDEEPPTCLKCGYKGIPNALGYCPKCKKDMSSEMSEEDRTALNLKVAGKK
jgi:predicted Zn-ribbon and HTH transcriptional regulator